MELKNINNPEFINLGLRILEKNKELLVMIRYPFGNKDFVILKSELDFRTFLNQRKKKESISLFKDFHLIISGKVDGTLIKEIMTRATKLESFQWLSIKEQKSESDYDEWCFISNIDGLKEELEDSHGDYIKVILEPNWLDENILFHAYVPDEDGVVRPSSY